MSIAINLAGTPCCGVIYRYDVEDRELMLLDLGYCPDCGQYLGDMDEAEQIGFAPAVCEDGEIMKRARWDYNAAVNIFTGHTPTGCDGEELDLELV